MYTAPKWPFIWNMFPILKKARRDGSPKQRAPLKTLAYYNKVPNDLSDNVVPPADIEQPLWHSHWKCLSEDEHEDGENDDFTYIQVPTNSPEKREKDTLKRPM